MRQKQKRRLARRQRERDQRLIDDAFRRDQQYREQLIRERGQKWWYETECVRCPLGPGSDACDICHPFL